MLTALILVCSLTLTPDLTDCTRTTAVDVLWAPVQTGNPATCFMQGQAYLAQTSLHELAPDERIKVVCARSRPIDTTQVIRPVAQ